MAITTPHTALPDLSAAVYAALKADSTFTGLAQGPFDPPEEEQTFPFVSFGEHIEMGNYKFQNTSHDIVFMLHIWSQQFGTGTFGFKEAYTILDAIANVLEAKTLTLTNFTMTRFTLDQTVKMLDPDGVTKHLVVKFRTKLTAK